MCWPELLSHPFWTEVIREEEQTKEEDEGTEEENREEGSSGEGVRSMSLRCVCFHAPSLLAMLTQ